MSENYFLEKRAKEVVEGLGLKRKPKFGFTLGSGWGSVVHMIKNAAVLSYSSIGLPACGVAGHAGNFVFGELHGVEVVVQQGRYHLYEGKQFSEILLPVAIMKECGIDALVLTNAAGGINQSYAVGDLMFLSDHINLTGRNPLIGVEPTKDHPVFVDMTQIYDRKMAENLCDAAEDMGISHHRGVYMQVLGPSFETPAEIRAFRSMGADAVGMSTVMEAIYARYLGLRVAGISCITNMAAGIKDQKLCHEDVLKESNARGEKFSEFLDRFVCMDK